jgi:hypothetical protein
LPGKTRLNLLLVEDLLQIHHPILCMSSPDRAISHPQKRKCGIGTEDHRALTEKIDYRRVDGKNMLNVSIRKDCSQEGWRRVRAG